MDFILSAFDRFENNITEPTQRQFNRVNFTPLLRAKAPLESADSCEGGGAPMDSRPETKDSGFVRCGTTPTASENMNAQLQIEKSASNANTKVRFWPDVTKSTIICKVRVKFNLLC